MHWKSSFRKEKVGYTNMNYEDMSNYEFNIGSLKWAVSYVPSDNEGLKCNSGEQALGMTYCKTCHIYIDNTLQPALMRSTVIHELVHAFSFSYGFHLLANEETEESIADFFGTFGDEIIRLADQIMKVGVS